MLKTSHGLIQLEHKERKKQKNHPIRVYSSGMVKKYANRVIFRLLKYAKIKSHPIENWS